MASPSAPETQITQMVLGAAFLPSEGIPSVGSLQAASLFSPPSHSTCILSASARTSAASEATAASLAAESIASRASKRPCTSKPSVKPPSPARKRARTVSPKKVPVKDEEEDSKPAAKESCCICVSDVNADDLAKISGCNHLFCFECIEKWSERENSCPLCKVRFTKIDRVKKTRKKGQTNTKKVKQRDQRSDLPGAALEGLLASLARRGTGPGNVARLIFSGSSIAVGVRASGHSFPGSPPPFFSDMFGDSDDEETPFSAFFRAFHNAPLPSSQLLRPVSITATMASRSYASNSGDTTAGNQENPLTIDDDSGDEEEVVEVVGVRTVTRRRV